jgi:APA family basic amino acid/polyamine antiporter
MLHGAAIIFFAFVGFNTVTVIAEEVKDPVRNVPRALLIAFIVCATLYICVSIVVIGLVDWLVLATSNAPLETALHVATENPLVLAYVSVAALFATASVVMSSIFGGSRALFAMARQKLLPSPITRISVSGVPFISVVIVSVVMAAIVLVSRGNLDTLAQVFNFGTILTFFFINMSLVKLRWDNPEAVRGFRVPAYPLTPVLGILSCALLLAFLSRYALIFGVIWIAIGILIFEANIKNFRKTVEAKLKKELYSEKRPEQ